MERSLDICIKTVNAVEDLAASSKISIAQPLSKTVDTPQSGHMQTRTHSPLKTNKSESVQVTPESPSRALELHSSRPLAKAFSRQLSSLSNTPHSTPRVRTLVDGPSSMLETLATDEKKANSPCSSAPSTSPLEVTVSTVYDDSDDGTSADSHSPDETQRLNLDDHADEGTSKDGRGSEKVLKHPPTERAAAIGRGAVPTKRRGVATKGRASHTRGVAVPTKRNTATEGHKALDDDYLDEDEAYTCAEIRESSRRKEYIKGRTHTKQSSREDFDFLGRNEEESEDDS